MGRRTINIASLTILCQGSRLKSSASRRFVGGPDLRKNLLRVHEGRLSISSLGTLSHDGTFVRFLTLDFLKP
jgi:hypothetical protein